MFFRLGVLFAIGFWFASPALGQPGLIGDYNDDGSVDGADYVQWRNHVGTSNTLPNDLHGGTIGPLQFDQWKANFGNVTPGSGADASIGEEQSGGAGGSTRPMLQLIAGGTVANGRLNAAGNWVWKVQISTTNPVPTGSSALSAEIGFKEVTSKLLDANNLSTGSGDDFDTVIPGNPIYGWENPETSSNGFPTGLQSNCAGGLCTENTPGDDPNTVFAALGSRIYGTPTTSDFIEIIVLGPCSGSGGSCNGAPRLTTTIEVRGAYPNRFRIAEANPSAPPDTVNHDVVGFTETRTAMAGDANLDGSVDSTDYNIWLSNAGGSNIGWQHGDFNDDNLVNGVDYDIWLNGTSLPGDFDFDGMVDGADYVAWRKGPTTTFTESGYDVWQHNFGRTAGGGGAEAAVPESAGAALLMFVSTLLTARNRAAKWCRTQLK